MVIDNKRESKILDGISDKKIRKEITRQLICQNAKFQSEKNSDLMDLNVLHSIGLYIRDYFLREKLFLNE